jgi:hypothetical protein
MAAQLIYADEDFQQTMEGLGDNGSDLVFRTTCTHCGALISERRYRAETMAIERSFAEQYGREDGLKALEHLEECDG